MPANTHYGLPQRLKALAGRLDSELMLSLPNRWQLFRDRLVSQPEFRRRAAAFPLTRWIARRRARSLFDLVAGFVYSQVLLAAVQLNLFETLAKGPRSNEALANACGIGLDPMRRLLEAGVALELFDSRGPDRYGLGALGVALVNNPGLAAMIEHHKSLYSDLADPLNILREPSSTALSSYWAYSKHDNPGSLVDQRIGDYSHLMSVSQSLVVDQVLDAYSMKNHRHLMDVGGGQGKFLESVSRRWPNLTLTLFDLPAVVKLQPERACSEYASRIQRVAGNFLQDPLPSGADLISLVRILHDHDDSSVRTLLSSIYAALPSRGTVLIAEPMGGVQDAKRMSDAYFGFYFLAMRQGRLRSQADIIALLADAGFVEIRAIPTHLPLQTSLVVGQRLA